MNITFFWIIYYCMMGVEFLVLIPFIMQYKQLDKASKCILYYILSCTVFAGGSYILQKLYGNNMWFFNLMYFIQFVILSIFYHLLIKNPTVRTIIKYMPIVILAIFTFDLFFIEGVRAYNSISSGVKDLVLLIYGLYYFLQMIRDKELIEKAIYVDSLPVFWYSAGLFIFSCTEFLFCISYNHLQALQTSGVSRIGMTIAILTIQYVVGIISMILLYIGLSKLKKLRYADS